MTNSILAKMAVQISAQNAEFNRAMSDSQSTLKKFTGGVEEFATKVGLAFGVREVASFALEITKLAGQADGVRQAFTKIKDSAAVLQEMKDATRGTVNELDLMKSAVQASNFGIPIQQLGTLFQFAYERAKATGQSVDYLVNSIVTGIGRKSPLILDNLGISAVQLKEKLGGVSTEAASIGQVAEAVGKIASESLEKTGRSAVTAAEKIAQVSARWEDIKEKLGSGLAEKIASEDPAALLTNFNNQLIVWADKNTPLWKKILFGAEGYAELAAEIEKRNRLLTNNIPLGPDSIQQLYANLFGDKGKGGATSEPVGIIKSINNEIKRLTEEKEKAFGPNAQQQIAAINQKLQDLKQTLEALNKMTPPDLSRKFNPISLPAVNVPTVASMIAGLQGDREANIMPGLGRNAINEMTDAMIKAQDRAERFGKVLKMNVGAGITSMAQALGQLAAGLNVNFGGVFLQTIGNIAINLGETLVATGLGIEAFKKSLASLDGLAAIAAGGALIAAGAAFVGLAQSSAASGGGSSRSESQPRFADIGSKAIQVNVNGVLRGDGRDLVAVINQQGYISSVIGGG